MISVKKASTLPFKLMRVPFILDHMIDLMEKYNNDDRIPSVKLIRSWIYAKQSYREQIWMRAVELEEQTRLRLNLMQDMYQLTDLLEEHIHNEYKPPMCPEEWIQQAYDYITLWRRYIYEEYVILQV